MENPPAPALANPAQDDNADPTPAHPAPADPDAPAPNQPAPANPAGPIVSVPNPQPVTNSGNVRLWGATSFRSF